MLCSLSKFQILFSFRAVCLVVSDPTFKAEPANQQPVRLNVSITLHLDPLSLLSSRDSVKDPEIEVRLTQGKKSWKGGGG